MAIGDIFAIPLVAVTPGITAAGAVTVPSNEEWTIRFLRATCLLTSGSNPTISAGTSSACNELCFNEFVPIGTASVNGSKNIIGPDFVTLPPTTVIWLRSSTASAIRVLIGGTRKQVS